jgi:hypothetical protein
LHGTAAITHNSGTHDTRTIARARNIWYLSTSN